MEFNSIEFKVSIRLVLIFGLLCGAAYLVIQEQWTFVVLILLFSAWWVWELFRMLTKTQDELNQFLDSVQYRDFSRHFDERHAPEELKPLRKGFNQINSAFKVISKEKETQYLYLAKILELVDTGILSYELVSGEVIWMNESLKSILGIPYLKSIQSLNQRDHELYNEVISLKTGDSKIVSITKDFQTRKLVLSMTAFHTDDKVFRLVAFQNVNEALDETESLAWQKLLSVMTHEIMNSVAPISSLANTLKLRVAEMSAESESVALEDIELGIDTIRRRSEGLMRFSQVYRNLNKIASANLQQIPVRVLLENVKQLMSPTLNSKNIQLDIQQQDQKLQLEADTNLIEQVLINLLVNAIEAVRDVSDPKIIISATLGNHNKVIIKVADNGSGMAPELLDKIFVPFFSTKKSGSGIGLSLCKQIMLLHRGQILVQSVEGKGSVFTLQFG
ncbi:MAG: HAMP domain-containing histidine kinase [Saprospiraceae bacterium]|nr:HAMP domain-containing histidine kinase [Saprospiraceae bacterium]